MDDKESTKATPDVRIGIIEAVRTPLGFFVLVVLIVEVVLTAFVLKLDPGSDRTLVIVCMVVLIFALVLIVAGIAIWRPDALRGKERQVKETKYSVLIGPPEKLPNLDITLINWDDGHCFLISGNLREPIRLVPSRKGPTYSVNVPAKVLTRVDEEAIAFELKDKKGNRWEVRSFYLYENLLPLSLVESKEKIIQDYSQEDQ